MSSRVTLAEFLDCSDSQLPYKAERISHIAVISNEYLEVLNSSFAFSKSAPLDSLPGNLAKSFVLSFIVIDTSMLDCNFFVFGKKKPSIKNSFRQVLSLSPKGKALLKTFNNRNDRLLIVISSARSVCSRSQ